MITRSLKARRKFVFLGDTISKPNMGERLLYDCILDLVKYGLLFMMMLNHSGPISSVDFAWPTALDCNNFVPPLPTVSN